MQFARCFFELAQRFRVTTKSCSWVVARPTTDKQAQAHSDQQTTTEMISHTQDVNQKAKGYAATARSTIRPHPPSPLSGRTARLGASQTVCTFYMTRAESYRRQGVRQQSSQTVTASFVTRIISQRVRSSFVSRGDQSTRPETEVGSLLYILSLIHI